MRTSLISLVAAAVLSVPFLAGAADPVADAAAIVKAANWDAMETITVELAEYSFTPQDLKLKAGQPYRLVIRNVGQKDHYYTATEFFKSVAWRKVQTPKPNGGEIKAPYFTAVEAYKNGGSVELFFVTVNKGEFDVICTIEDHKDQGMFGKIVVE
ncbi:cupredoxin domain-containing protein [Aromatoleum toluclasticum]|uniref:cupredoxin domain-containing protein n=1 Tax=Aromatoleum toluclasticum TaxID=92003 RepID=UPI00035D335B|nr:cupredoxin domain-containing protein [Aromatoleum toluclasticum]MCC4117448.1 cupredoxin domain-containing protein [Aromatoleum toluclasticum]